MKLKIKVQRKVKLITLMLVLSALTAGAQTLSPKEIEFLRVQDSVLSNNTEHFFDFDKPGYHSNERKEALFLIDAITHDPKPHNSAIKEFFFNRYKKSLESIKATNVDSGVVVWNVYNMAYIVKSKDIIIAFDLVLLPDCMIKEGEMEEHKKVLSEMVNLCDILFVSHNHEDHYDNYVAQEFLSQNKPVIAEDHIFIDKDFYNKITHVTRNGKEIHFSVPGVEKKLALRIYPGHQAIAADAAMNDNFAVVTLPNNITIAHSGDQSWGPDFSWLDTMKNDVNIDILMVNTWTADPDRLVKGLNPKVILPGHVNEMDHTILGRVPYWKSYKVWKNSEAKTIQLFWGESFIYNR